MEPAEVALVVDGQAFQKVCLETGVGVRPPVQTRAPSSGAMYFCVREGVWVSLCVCVCVSTGQDVQVISLFPPSGSVISIAVNTVKLSISPTLKLFKVILPLGTGVPACHPNTRETKTGGLL